MARTIEIQGIGHGHQGTRDLIDDVEKNSEAFAQGWTVVYFTWKMIANGEAMGILERAGVRVQPGR